MSPEEVVNEFERRLVAEPNSSLLWIRYVSAVLRLADVRRARDVAERALRTVSFRAAADKENLWVAYMNLELHYGDAERLEAVFRRACTYCDAKAMHVHLARILGAAGRHADADDAHAKLAKAFPQSCKAWTLWAEALYPRDIGAARKLLSRAKAALPARKHAKAALRFALLEYRCGSAERGRTLFEALLAEAPRRTDVWGVYVAQEERLVAAGGPPEHVRRLYERVLALRLSSKRARAFFKRYLAFERSHGSPQGVDHVKALVRAYVERM